MERSMSKYEIPDEIPAFGHYLKKINNQDCNFEYCEVMHAPFPIKILRWNMTDFGHVNWVHRRCYHHCKVLVHTGRVTLLEYGVNQFFFLKLPIWFNTVMYHEIKTPNYIRHLSSSPLGGYTYTEMKMEEYIKDNKVWTRIDHIYKMRASKFIHPFLRWFIRRWTDVLWKEDYAMLERRNKVLNLGFKDHPEDTVVRAHDGFG